MILKLDMLGCRCGLQQLSIRASATEGVGLATCGAGHHSFLLDSREVWADVIQAGRPKELRCRCKGRTFTLAVDYTFRDDAKTVRAVSVRARCTACAAERAVFDGEIDYEPTDELVARPLDPVEDPWVKARRVELTGLWTPEDVEQTLRFIGSLPEAQVYFAGAGEAPRALSAEAARALTVAAVRDRRSYHLFFACTPLSFPANLRDAWRHLAAVHLGAPIRMNYRTGLADLYYVTYATEDLVAANVVPRSTAFLTFAERIRSWLQSAFVSDRGKNTIDNPSEYQRLRGGW